MAVRERQHEWREYLWAVGGYVEDSRDGGGVHFQRGARAALRDGKPSPPRAPDRLTLLALARHSRPFPAARAPQTPNKLIFCKGFANWIDLIAIVPFYVSQAADGDALAAFSVFRVVRLVRVFRVFKMGKSSIGISLMTATMAESMKVLFILMYFVAIAMVLFSSMMYYAESDGEQAEFYASIPRTFWWCLVTMTTVGYGDGYPVTTAGRIIAVVTMFCGILILALPISVIGSNFARQYARQQFEQEAQKAVREGHGQREKDKVNAKRLREFLLTLDIHGSLKVPLPQTDDAAQAIIDQFDPTKQSKLDTKQWQALLQDTVIDPSEFTDTTILKLASDLHKARAEVSELQQMMRQQATRSDEQISELRGMLVSLGAKPGMNKADAALSA